MAEPLSSRELYELLIGGGLRGSKGKIEATRFYYNDEFAQFDPQDGFSPILQISESQFVSVGTSPQWILGTNTNPYFVVQEGQQLPTLGDHEIVALAYRYGCEPAQPGSPDLYGDYYLEECYLDSSGNIIGTNRNNCKDLFSESHAEIANFGYGATIREGTYGAGMMTVMVGGEGSTREYYTGYENVISGESFDYYAKYWGAGQKPIEDDGVTPTGGSGGGGGSYSRPDEEVGVPGLPSYSVCDIGTTALYEMSPAGLHDFSNFLWSSNFIDNIIKNRESPIENIIQISMVPRLEFVGTAGSVVIGNLTAPASGLKLSTSFYQIDCGTINVTEYYRNFADYGTSISIYLPFCGIFDIDVNDCMDGVIGVKYNIDVFTGECIAFVSCNTNGVWHVLQTHNGNVASQFPISDRNMMPYYAGLIGAVTSALTGNIMGGVQGVLNSKPTFSRAGSIGGTAGMLNIKYPYLIFSTPQIFTAETFKQNRGYMSNLSGKLSSFSGFVSCDPDKLDLTGLNLMDEEMEMLYSILSEGIYI